LWGSDVIAAAEASAIEGLGRSNTTPAIPIRNLWFLLMYASDLAGF
jgi:hypothetical protein